MMESTEKPELWGSAVIDFSPSEQLTGDPSRVITMGIAFGYSDPGAIERVGLNSDPGIEKYDLKKWAGKSLKYKLNALNHMHDLVKNHSVSFAKYHCEEHAIRQIGVHHFNTILKDIHGINIDDFPAVSRSKSGRGRWFVTITEEDEEEGEERRVLIDEFLIMAWIADGIYRVLAKLEDLYGKPFGLHLYLDRLPLETDTEIPIKGGISTMFLRKLCGNRIEVFQNENGQKTHKDFLADNVAGLAAESFQYPDSEIALSVKNSNLFWMELKFVTPSK